MAIELSTSLARIYARAPLGIHLGLDAMRAACARAGDPQTAFAAVHVAGTNGKGSVSAMVETMARAGGLRTGLYTSPHLCRFAERIRIDGEPIGDDALASALAQALDFGRAPELSFFEAATLAAFIAFRDAGVDIAVLEVGLGGRLDATNVIPPPRVSAITRIALDHMELLGATLPLIACEKAGIAKPGVETVVGAGDADVMAALAETIAARGGTMVVVDGDASVDALLQNAPIALAGAHQVHNARIAVGVGMRLGLPRAALRKGLATVSWPGRLERIERDGTAYLLDAAHNADGAEALAAHLEALIEAAPSPLRIALVFGALADKPWRSMIERLAPLAAFHAFAAPGGRTPADPGALASMYDGIAFDHVSQALSAAAESAPKPDLVVVAGSIYLIGEARAELLGLPRDPVVAL